MNILTHIISGICIVIVFYYFLLAIWYSILLVLSFPDVIKSFKQTKANNIINSINDDGLIPITVITPAFNESKRIVNMIYSVLQSDYKHIDLIIVNDGSTDNMMEVLTKEFSLVEIPQVMKHTLETSKINHYYQSTRFNNLTIIDKEHGPYNNGADALNAGLNACKTPLVITLDADTIIEPNAISQMLFTLLSNTHCVSVGGSLYVLNGNIVEHGALKDTTLPNEFIPAAQGAEYLRSFLFGRVGWNSFGGALCFPGAFTLFETQALHDVGGFDRTNPAYDAEIVTKLHHWMRKNKHPNYLLHSPNAQAWTEVPSTLAGYWRQRNLWQRGMWRGALKHIEMLFNPAYGVIGLVSLPAYILFEILGPIVEFFSYIIFFICLFLGIVSPYILLWFLILAWGYITLVTLSMLLLNQITFNRYHDIGDAFRVVWSVLVEMFGLRQIRATCCTFSTVQYFWNKIRGRSL